MSNQKIHDALTKLEKALKTLKVMVCKPVDVDRANIDATIQRFEFTIELFWNYLKRLLADKGIVVQYPKDVLREAYSGHLIDDEMIWLAMLDDRNVTSHTYDEELADDVYKRILDYYPFLEQALVRIKKYAAVKPRLSKKSNAASKHTHYPMPLA